MDMLPHSWCPLTGKWVESPQEGWFMWMTGGPVDWLIHWPLECLWWGRHHARSWVCNDEQEGAPVLMKRTCAGGQTVIKETAECRVWGGRYPRVMGWRAGRGCCRCFRSSGQEGLSEEVTFELRTEIWWWLRSWPVKTGGGGNLTDKGSEVQGFERRKLVRFQEQKVGKTWARVRSCREWYRMASGHGKTPLRKTRVPLYW